MNPRTNNTEASEEETTPETKKRGRRKKKEAVETDAEGRSKAMYRRWQRGWVKPAFALTREEASELLLKYLRSRPGRPVLKNIIDDGFKGVEHLGDDKLAKYLEDSNLLSRYPHTVEIKG